MSSGSTIHIDHAVDAEKWAHILHDFPLRRHRLICPPYSARAIKRIRLTSTLRADEAASTRRCLAFYFTIGSFVTRSHCVDRIHAHGLLVGLRNPISTPLSWQRSHRCRLSRTADPRFLGSDSPPDPVRPSIPPALLVWYQTRLARIKHWLVPAGDRK